MRLLVVILAGILALSQARAEEHEVKVFIDGREVKGAALQPDGTIRIPPDELSKALGATAPVATSEVPVARPVPPPPPPAAPASPIVASVAPVAPPPAPPAPSIKGNLIWYHNVWDLKSPDHGAHVWLLTESEAASLANAAGGKDNEPIPSTAPGWDTKLATGYKFPHAVANEHGEFFFDHVPSGRYVLVIKSAHCKWTTPRDRDGKMRFKPVEVREGAPVDFMFDLGRTADALK